MVIATVTLDAVASSPNSTMANPGVNCAFEHCNDMRHLPWAGKLGCSLGAHVIEGGKSSNSRTIDKVRTHPSFSSIVEGGIRRDLAKQAAEISVTLRPVVMTMDYCLQSSASLVFHSAGPATVHLLH